MRVISVKELNSYIKSRIETDVLLSLVCVRGEISNFKHHYTGHMYMSLKDDSGSIRAVMFRSAASNLKFEPKNGMNVLVTGRVSVYERDGQYQIYIDTMIPDGIGQLYAAYEQLKMRLESEGYFEQKLKKPIPRFPKSIGVVTAPNGAAVKDIINVITRRYPLANIKIFPALVQGAGAKESICKGIEYLNEKSLCDVIIVGRGGGSIEDLWAFNEECVAMAIFNSKIPIISAVGHETDFTISDFVSDLRAPTPSAAAEIATPSAEELINMLQGSQNRLCAALSTLVKYKKDKLKALTERRIFREPSMLLENKFQLLDEVVTSFETSYTNALSKFSDKLSKCSYKLNALNPLNVLSRGYSVAYTDRTTIKKIKDFENVEEFNLQLSDGIAECVFKRIRGEYIGDKK